MSIKDEFFALARKDEIARNEVKEGALNEAYNGFAESVVNKVNTAKNAAMRIPYTVDVAKEVICEAFSELYMNSIPIDDYFEYRGALHESATEMLKDEMSTVTSISGLRDKFKNTSPYMKAMCELAVGIAEKKADDIAEKDQEYPKDVVLDSDDYKLISDFEKIQGKDVYADALKDRVVDVYKAEAEIADAEKQKTQDIVEELAKRNDGNLNESIINDGLRLSNNSPKTLFNAIFMNKSRSILNEAGAGADLDMYKNDILVETLCTYTLLECVHALGIKTIDSNEREQMKSEFLYS